MNNKIDLKHAETTGPLIELFFHVHRKLGYGFLERVYASAMMISAPRFGLEITNKVRIEVLYEGTVIGRYEPDLLVNKTVLVELKSCKSLAPEHEAQLLNYLKATRYEVGLLLNFGPEARYKRMVFDNTRKGSLEWSR